MARALIGVAELDTLEKLVQKHLRVLRRIEHITEQAAQYDLTPTELPGLEAEAARLRTQLKVILAGWQGRL